MSGSSEACNGILIYCRLNGGSGPPDKGSDEIKSVIKLNGSVFVNVCRDITGGSE